MTDTQSIEAPDGWHWGGGNRGGSYYTTWLYTDKVLYPDGEFGWEAMIFWDAGNKHTVEFIQYTRLDPSGDHGLSEYPEHVEKFDTEEEAVEYAIEKAKELR